MIQISLSGQAQVQSFLTRLMAIELTVAEWFKSGEVDQIMQDSFAKNFSSQGRPKWTALSKETIEDRLKKGFGSGPILSRTGNLQDEISSLKGEISIGARQASIQWGIDQLRGDEKVKFGAHQSGKGRSGQDLPQRKMIGFQPEDSKRLISALTKWIYFQFK
jgi:phage gpG-like protein